ncbi:PREDICTED: uncharacterized protein LOC104822141 [Tarenaya hassleriana]|uniref:uncharacterized protein LOC104822141 n=1 Tax=Tarenaya hassleriana TaxID=28532 RepID=UPI00053C1969|nr:PREDICTED: uncharacterized protein LOC104822141 [Tarenaya hassleriana]
MDQIGFDPTRNKNLASQKYCAEAKGRFSERNMAANGARRTLQLSSSSAKTLIGRSSAVSSASKFAGVSVSESSSASSRFSLRRFTSSRVPVGLGGALSMMPLHSVTASALFTSLLSLSNQNWGSLSEGFATPL